MSPWGWQPKRTEGIWRYGASWLRPLMSAIPALTVMLLLIMFYILGGTLTTARGVAMELPKADFNQGEVTDQVALILKMPKETLVYFDDSRYAIGDGASTAVLAEDLAQRMSRSENRTLLVLADRRVKSGELFEFAALARRSGVRRLIFAEKHLEANE